MTQATPQNAPSTLAPNSAPVVGARSPWLLFWQVMGHSLWLTLLLLLTAAAFAAHLLLPQLPTALAADPLARSAWLADTAAQLPGGPALNALGLLDLAHSAALRVLLPLLAATLLLRLFNRLQLALNTRELAPPTTALPSTRAFDLQLAAVAEHWQGELDGRFERTKVEPEDQGEGGDLWYADRNQRFTWFPALIELGLLLMLLSFLLNLRLGWQIDDIQLDPGAVIPLTPYSAQTISLDPAAATLILCCPQRSLAIDSAGSPLAALRIHSARRGPALAITASAGGEPLLLQGIEQGGRPTSDLLVHFPQARSERTIALPDRNLFLRVAGAGPAQFRIQVLDPANDVLLAAQLSDEQTFTLDDVELTLRPSHFVTLGVVSRAWLWLLPPAVLLVGIGLALRRRYPYSRTGIRQNDAGVAVRWQGQSGARPPLADLIASLTPPNPTP